jgi:hypothetical protein
MTICYPLSIARKLLLIPSILEKGLAYQQMMGSLQFPHLIGRRIIKVFAQSLLDIVVVSLDP